MNHDINHLAIIMDGNMRWSKENKKQNGHKYGAKRVKDLLPYISQYKIKYLTLYAFSSENWQRPKSEISGLLNLLGKYVSEEASILQKYDIKLQIIGRITELPTILKFKIENALKLTQNNKSMVLTIAFNYGGRGEIIDACQKIIDSGIKKVTEQNFQKYLYSSIPDVDLLIRTSGEKRVSNFLLWQIAYTEIYFTDKFWPDFDEFELDKAILNYSSRKRNFGARK